MEDVQSTVSETTEKLNNLRLKLFSTDIFNYLLGSYKNWQVLFTFGLEPYLVSIMIIMIKEGINVITFVNSLSFGHQKCLVVPVSVCKKSHNYKIWFLYIVH